MILEEFDNSKPIFTPESFVDRKHDCIKTAVGFFSKKAEDKFIEIFNPQVYAQFLCGGVVNVYKITHNGKDILFYRSPIGAPATVALMEEISTMGVENFLMSGTCGVLNSNVEPYTLFVPQKAIRDEGTSYHYQLAGDIMDLDKQIVASVCNYLENNNIFYKKTTTWTTDAIYRETENKVDNRKKMGAEVVEMECSAMTAFAKHKGLNFAQILYGADVVVKDSYDKRNLIDGAMDAEEKIIRLVIDCASQIF